MQITKSTSQITEETPQEEANRLLRLHQAKREERRSKPVTMVSYTHA